MVVVCRAAIAPVVGAIPGGVGDVVDPDDVILNEFQCDAHGQIWENMGDVRGDTDGVYRYNARIRWPEGDLITAVDRKPLDYFLLTFPHAQWAKIVLHTNREMVVLGLRDSLSVRELQKFLGIRLVMTLEHGHGAVDDYWKSDGGTGFLRPRDYGARTGMCLSRFKNISRALCFHDKSQVSVRNCLLYNN